MYSQARASHLILCTSVLFNILSDIIETNMQRISNIQTWLVNYLQFRCARAKRQAGIVITYTEMYMNNVHRALLLANRHLCTIISLRLPILSFCPICR